jgi:hypothetical protein
MDDEHFPPDGADQHHNALEPDADTLPPGERVVFGYDVLPEPMAARLRQAVVDINEAHSNAIDAIAKIGNSLIAARTLLVRQGEFTFWVNAEFNWTLRTAQRYMSAAKFLAGKATCMSLLPAHLIYRISAPSADPEIVQDVVEAAEAGTPLAPKEIEGRLDATVLRRRREPQRDTAQVRQSSVLTQDPVETESPLGAAHDAADPIEDQPLISAAAAPAPVSVPAPTTMSILQVQLEHARRRSCLWLNASLRPLVTICSDRCGRHSITRTIGGISFVYSAMGWHRTAVTDDRHHPNPKLSAVSPKYPLRIYEGAISLWCRGCLNRNHGRPAWCMGGTTNPTDDTRRNCDKKILPAKPAGLKSSSSRLAKLKSVGRVQSSQHCVRYFLISISKRHLKNEHNPHS